MGRYYLLWHIKMKDGHTVSEVECFQEGNMDSLQKHIQDKEKKERQNDEVKDVILHEFQFLLT